MVQDDEALPAMQAAGGGGEPCCFTPRTAR